MEFTKEKAIYLQIVDLVFESILHQRWTEGERIPSVRDLAVSLEVNPNTVVRSYTYLQENGIIHNRRGLGYYVSPEATEKARAILRDEFIRHKLPRLVKSMKLLGIGFDELKQLMETW